MQMGITPLVKGSVYMLLGEMAEGSFKAVGLDMIGSISCGKMF